MKALFTSILLAALAYSAFAQQPEGVSMFTFTARTAVTGKSAKTNGVDLKQVVAVSVDVNFLNPPPEAWEVQCFFIGKNDSSKLRYIFDAVKRSVQGKSTRTEFLSKPVGASVTRNNSVLFEEQIRSESASESEANRPLGGKIEGWVVRLVYQGKVLRAESNQPNLTQLLKSKPEVFDQAVQKLCPQ